MKSRPAAAPLENGLKGRRSITCRKNSDACGTRSRAQWLRFASEGQVRLTRVEGHETRVEGEGRGERGKGSRDGE
jgi:hypothetical protein